MLTLPRPIRRERTQALEAVRFSADMLGVSLLLALTAVVSWDRLRFDREVSSLDNPTFYIPWFAHVGERLRDGDIPGWLPALFSGTPLAGDPQSGWMYLPSMLLFGLFEPLAAFKAFVFFHLLLAGLSTYTLARLLGIGIGGSLLAAVVFEFGPFLKYTACCVGYTQVAAWVPLSFIGAELAIRGRSWFARIGGWGIAGFAISQELGGWIGQGGYYGLLALGGFILYRAWLTPLLDLGRIRSEVTSVAIHGLAIFSIGFGLAAGGILPRLEAVSRSSRADGYSENLDPWSIAWPTITTIDRLLSVDREARWYLGGSVLVLAILAPLIARGRTSVKFFALFSLVVIGLSLPHNPLHDLFYLLPRFEVLHEHYSSRIMIVLGVGPAMLAGAAFDALARGAVSARRLALSLPIPAAILLLAISYVVDRGYDMTEETRRSILLVTALLIVAAVLSTSQVRARLPRPTTALRLVLVALMAAVIWDLTGRWYGGTIQDSDVDPQAQRNMAAYTDTSGAGTAAEYLMERAREEGPSRYFGYDPGYLTVNNGQGGYRIHYRKSAVQDLLLDNRAILLGLQDVQGYDPVQPGRYAHFIDALNGMSQEYHELNILPSGIDSSLLDLINARYIIVPLDIPPGRPDLLHLSQQFPTVYVDRDVRILENESAFPRAWIVHEAEQMQPSDALAALAAGDVDPRQTALVEKEPPPLSPPLTPDDDYVAIDLYEADRIRLTAETSADGLLILSENYDPGWHAYVDGQRVPLYRTDYLLRGVPLTPGKHSVELRYEPPSIRLGMAISIATASTLAVSTVVAARRRRFHVGTNSVNNPLE